MPRILLSRGARRDLERITPRAKDRILKKLTELERLPDPVAAAKRLRNDPEGTFRLRIGDWRAKFVVVADSIVITRIRHRSEAYRP
jgi:mRNA-degrading endonuclease RelE of RelBE toxin-antitoxin system